MTIFDQIKECLSNNRHPLQLQKSNSPNIICSKVEPHWRSNKSLPTPFVVLVLSPCPDGTKVTVSAGNSDCPSGEVRNESAKIVKQMAKFNDLRFVGKSGRGKSFHLSITVHSSPVMVAVVPHVIKVTVDGPRDARATKSTDSSNRKRAYMAYNPYAAIPPTIIPPPALNAILLQQQFEAYQRSLMLSTVPVPHMTPPVATSVTPTTDSSPDSRNTSSNTISLVPDHRTKRSRNTSETSLGSSPTIWRPF